MPKATDPKTLSRVMASIKPKRRVLLINPPVHETNYRWLHWNQPLDLLKIGSWLRQELGADVRLYDFLVPDKGGRTPKHKLDRDWDVHGVQIDAWHFGQSIESFRKVVQSWTKRSWVPDCVIVSNLTSYWLSGLRQLLFAVRNLGGPYRDIPIVLHGNVPRFSPSVSAELPCITLTAVSDIDPIESPSSLDLYSEMNVRAQFCALDVRNPKLVEEVKFQVEKGYVSFTFFNDDIFAPGSRLEELAASGVANSSKVHFEVICGAKPGQLTVDRLKALQRLNVRSMYVDYASDPKGNLLIKDYERIRDYSLREGFLRRPGLLSGFIDFGLPGEDFERLVYNTLIINKWLGGIILKPFGVLVDKTSEQEREAKWPRAEDQSPHAFPYMSENKVSVEDYLNLYRWQALLNYRNRGTTFDFLSDTLLGKTVRTSVMKESWTIDNIIKEGQRGANQLPTHGLTLPSTNL